jgi:preprotein translocase subunit SecF
MWWVDKSAMNSTLLSGCCSFSVTAMLVYATIRFEFKLAMGAVLFVPDVVVTIGILP